MTDSPKRRESATAERRWPMATAVLAAAALQLVTPRQGRLPIWWILPIIEVGALVLIVIEDPGRIDRRTRSSRGLTLGLIGIMAVATLLSLIVLIDNIITSRNGVTATVLLGRGATLWITNVIVFSLLFWELDRGGPAERAADSGIAPSFAFPENAMPELAPKGWLPRYPDYLYLSFTNATAFSPTDTLPLMTWAKMTMMIESVISLVTAVMVLARAINVLPG